MKLNTYFVMWQLEGGPYRRERVRAQNALNAVLNVARREHLAEDVDVRVGTGSWVVGDKSIARWRTEKVAA